MAHYDDVNTPLLAIIGFVSAILTFAVIVAVQVLYFHYEQRDFERKVVNTRDVTADNLIAEQEAKLGRYAWIDRDKDQVEIPIDRAMKLVVRQTQRQSSPETENETP